MLRSRFTLHVSRLNLFQAAALLIACAAAWPLLAEPGLLNTRGGGDSPFLLQRLHQLETALRAGHFPVRWMPDANYGYGYPFFNFYAPLSIYIAAIFRFIGFSYVRAIHLTQLLGFLVAAWGMFQLGRRWHGRHCRRGRPWAGLLAAVAYTVAPFHMVNVYVRGDSLAEFWAMALYPLVILAADELLTPAPNTKRPVTDNRVKIALFALSYAALILSHNISALIFTPFLLLYLLLRAWPALVSEKPDRFKKIAYLWYNFKTCQVYCQYSLVPLCLALLLALGLSAWFFLPAMAERALAQLEPVTSGYFHFSNHFRRTDLVQSSLLFNYDVTGGRAFRLGLAQAATAALGLAILCLAWRRRPTPPPAARPFILLTLLIATFMLTPLSRPLWEHLPLLAFTQFPWRFLSIHAFAASLATGAMALLPRQRIVGPAVIALLLLSSLGNLPVDHLMVTDADITAEKLAQYEWFTGNIGSSVSAEYLPYTVQPRPYTSAWLNSGQRWQVQALAGQVLASEPAMVKATRQRWRVTTADNGATVSLPTLYWPGWQATIDGREVSVRPSPGAGLITLDLPAGSHTVTVWLARTPVRLGAELISLAAVVVTTWLLAPAKGWQRPRYYAYGLLTLALLAIGLRLRPEHVLSANNLTWDFAQMGYLHHDLDGVPFDNGARLLAYVFSQEEVTAGQTLDITLVWSEASPPSSQVTLALASPAVNRFIQAPPLASQIQRLQSGQMTFHFTIPANAPVGLYAPQLRLSDGHALTPAGQRRGDLFLRPIRLTADRPVADDDAAVLAVRAVQVQQRNDQTLDLQLAWLTRLPLSHNYNVSLRLIDAQGGQVTQFDSQPGYGFQPSSGWPANRWVNDWLALPLPEELPDTAPYALVTHLYDVATGRVALTRRLGQVAPVDGSLVFQPNAPVFTLPETMTPLVAQFGAMIQLQGYILNQSNEAIHLTLYWRALAAGQVDYTRFVHLIAPLTEQVMTQSDGLPDHGTYPTDQWTAGEVVADSVTLDLTAVPPGQYKIGLGFYRYLDDSSFPRLAAVDDQGHPLPFDRALLPIPIAIEK